MYLARDGPALAGYPSTIRGKDGGVYKLHELRASGGWGVGESKKHMLGLRSTKPRTQPQGDRQLPLTARGKVLQPAR